MCPEDPYTPAISAATEPPVQPEADSTRLSRDLSPGKSVIPDRAYK